MVRHSSVLAWEIQQIKEHGELQSMDPKESNITEHTLTRQLELI